MVEVEDVVGVEFEGGEDADDFLFALDERRLLVEDAVEFLVVKQELVVGALIEFGCGLLALVGGHGAQ